MDDFSINGLDQIKVGDWVAPIKTSYSRPLSKQVTHWTGTLLRVTKVTEKRFYAGGMWVAKDTGRPIIGGGFGRYMPATPDMIAEVERKAAARLLASREISDFRARPEYGYATNIWAILDEMAPDHHPLDRLTVEEWAALHDKLSGREPHNG